jgi:Glycosyltransferase family 87
MVWAVLSVLFVAPFVDPRRPLALRHLDLVVLAAFALYFVRWMDVGHGSLRWALVIAYLGLAYVLARMLFIGLRPRAATHAPVLPLLPTRWLAIALVLLVAARAAYALVDERPLVDVGAASVAGAHLILDGKELYGADQWTGLLARGDTYGALNYVLYVPFAVAFDVPGRAARAAAYAFDALTILGLFLLGRRLVRAHHGTELGLALSYAWAASPYTLFVALYGYNDALVAAALVFTLVVLASPPLRALASGAGAAVKLVPGLVAPLFATASGQRRGRAALVYSAVFAGVIALSFLPFLPDGGVREVYDRTLGFQRGKTSIANFWSQVSALEWLRPIVQIAAVAVALAVAFVPRRKSVVQVAALGAAVIVLFELTLQQWLPSYVVWFAPLAFVALLASADDAEAPGERAGSTSGRAGWVWREARRSGIGPRFLLLPHAGHRR